MRIGIAGIVKNEASTLLEWIAYHRAVGIEHFVLVDNYSTDGTWQLLKKLRRRGLVTTFRFKTRARQAPQLDAYQQVLRTFGKHFDVLAFIDADEYLTPTNGQSSVIPGITLLFADDEVSAVALNWACFGSAGALFKENALVPERFTRRAKMDFSINYHYKSLVRPERAAYFYDPHQVCIKYGRYIMTNGEAFMPGDKYDYGSKLLCWDNLRINHYVVKSLEEFLVRKSRVGSAAQPGKIKHRSFFKGHDRNDESDQDMLPLMSSVHEQLDILNKLLNHPFWVERVESKMAKAFEVWDYGCHIVRKLHVYGLRHFWHKHQARVEREDS